MEFGVSGSPFCEQASLCHDLAINVSADSCETDFDTDGHISSRIN